MIELEQILKKNSVKPTAMRLLVLQFLLNKKSAISLTDVEDYFVKSDMAKQRFNAVYSLLCLVFQISPR